MAHAPAVATGTRYTVSAERRIRIIDGDPDGGGGHRAGTRRPGKTEFPASLTDDEIIEGIEAIANDPTSFPGLKAGSSRVKLVGFIQSVRTKKTKGSGLVSRKLPG